MPGDCLQYPCTTTYVMRCAQGELRHAHGHGAQPPRLTKLPRTRGHHPMPTRAPTATPAQRAALEKLKCTHGHGDHPPRPWPSIQRSLSRTRGHHPMPTGAPTATPTQRAALEKLQRSHGHGDQPPRPWPSIQRSGRRRGGITPCPRERLRNSRTASCAREASALPWAWGSAPKTLAEHPTKWPQTRGHHPMPTGAPTQLPHSELR